MRLSCLKVNSEFNYYGKKYSVISINLPLVTILRVDGDRETISVNLFDLIKDPSFISGRDVRREVIKESRNFKSLLDNLEEQKRAKVSERFQMIQPIIIFEGAKSGNFKDYYIFIDIYKDYIKKDENINDLTQEIIIERVAEKYLISSRTIKRYLASYRECENEIKNCGEEGLISKSGQGYIERKDNKKLYICHPKKPDMVLDVLDVRMDEKYIPIIKDVIENDYLNLQNITPTAVYDLIEINCIKQNIDTPPKKITIIKLLKRIDPQIRERMRIGKKADEKYDPIERGFSNEALFPLHIVEIDHMRLDMDIIDEKTGYVMNDVWITMGIDVFSRTVWCMYVSFEPPSINKVRKALQHGIFFKHAKEEFGSHYEWEVFGIPTIIMLDNGPEFKSIEVRRMIEESLKSHVRYRPVTTPRYGATIERLFGTINRQLIHRLAGTRKSNPEALGEYDAEGNAIFTLKDIIEILTNYITDIYHRNEHSGLPPESNIPIVRYFEGLNNYGMPEFIEEQDEDEYKMELLPVIKKPYTRDGIRHGNILYRNDKLSSLISSRNKKYIVKYDVDDVSHVYLLHPETGEYIEVFATNPSYTELIGVNLFYYKLILKMRKEEGKAKAKSIPGTDEVSRNKAALHDKMQKMMKNNRSVRKKAKRAGIEFTSLDSKSSGKMPNVRSLKEMFNLVKEEEEKSRSGYIA